MLRLIIRLAISVLIVALPYLSNVYGNLLVDDFSSLDNQNELEYYWDYFDDNMRWYPNDRAQIAPATQPSRIDVPYYLSRRHALGNALDTFRIKRYRFSINSSTTEAYATMPFTFGEPWAASYCSKGTPCCMPYVGIYTMLCKEGDRLDLTGVKAISFRIRSRVHTLQARFSIRTLDIETYSTKPLSEAKGDEFGYYGYPLTISPGGWQNITVNIDSLELPGIWAHEFPFDIKQCTKFVWEINDGGNLSKTSDTVDLDDVWIAGDGHTQALPDAHTLTDNKTALRAWYHNGCIRMDMSAGAGFSHCAVRLLDPRGSVVATSSAVSNGALQINVSGMALPDGLYILELSSDSGFGERKAVRSAFTLVR